MCAIINMIFNTDKYLYTNMILNIYLYDYRHIIIKEMCDCKKAFSSYFMETSNHGVLRPKESADKQLLCRVLYMPMCYSDTNIWNKFLIILYKHNTKMKPLDKYTKEYTRLNTNNKRYKQEDTYTIWKYTHDTEAC